MDQVRTFDEHRPEPVAADKRTDFRDLQPLLRPGSIAVVGATPSRLNQIWNFRRMGYQGNLLLVNPRYGEIDAMPCYPSIADLPEAVDLAYLLVNAGQVEEALTQTGERGIRAAVVVASGFAETGATAAQHRLRTVAANFDMLVCGPNCTGILNFSEGIPTSISQVADLAERRQADTPATAFVSQSGAFGTTIAALALAEGIDLGYFIGSGNEACLELADYVGYLAEQDDVDSIACYVEQLRDGPRFLVAARRAWAAGKTVMVVKTGRSEPGKRAAQSHTASLAGYDEVYDAAFRQAHVIRAEDEGHLLDLLRWQGLRRMGSDPRGVRTAIVTMSGGAGALLSDQCVAAGLSVPALSAPTQAALAPLWPSFASVQNPVDVTGVMVRDAGNLRETLRIIGDDDDIDNLLVYVNLGHDVVDDIVEALVQAAHRTKPVGMIWQQAPETAVERLRGNRVPLFLQTRRAVVSLASWVAHFADGRAGPAGPSRTVEAGGDGRDATSPTTVMSEGPALEVLAGHGLSVVEHRRAVGLQQIVEAAERIGFPCVLKVDSPLVPHRTEVGGVVAGITDQLELDGAYRSIQDRLGTAGVAGIEDFLVESHVTAISELIIGVNRDPTFGQVLVLGVGGIWAELVRAVSRVVLPATRHEIAEAVCTMPGIELINGARGRPVGDQQAVVDAAQAIAQFATAHTGTLLELDVNPLMVLAKGHGVVAADALIIWSDAPVMPDKPDD